jgi:hypothetical protein
MHVIFFALHDHQRFIYEIAIMGDLERSNRAVAEDLDEDPERGGISLLAARTYLLLAKYDLLEDQMYDPYIGIICIR